MKKKFCLKNIVLSNDNKTKNLTTKGAKNMSGGHFDYKQYEFEFIVDEIENIVKENGKEKKDEYGYDTGTDFPKEVIQHFVQGIKTIKQAQAYTHEIDWLLSGDTGDESFLERLNEKMDEIGRGCPECEWNSKAAWHNFDANQDVDGFLMDELEKLNSEFPVDLKASSQENTINAIKLYAKLSK